ncbi:hypothetical protein LGK95_04840 [Clostridium algoriphilum]|uniref:hypothetical protein n=1 Tax=Clostridium algoriphilum TaxID=198347 RepID=UPI001CF50DA8|nr:hypothetical protein [Clostridium algoriphilum]MCB2292864.1 hypothetical protein [Clostridium algoriphilum]
MSIISNAPIPQNQQTKKAFSKISFEAGEKFNARIVSTDLLKGEIDLKLLDGWQFSAKLNKQLEQTLDGSVLRFEVEGFEEGKLKLKLINEDKGIIEVSDNLEDTHYGKTLSSDKTDALLFEKMIKHDMPLTKDNIFDIKNLVDFREKISLNPVKEDIFIAKYLESRNVDINSEKANEITINLKNFFAALKNLDVDEILLFKENNIELTKGNLESFIKLFKGDSAIYNNLKDIHHYLSNSDVTKDIIKNNEASFFIENENIFKGIEEDKGALIPKNLEALKQNEEVNVNRSQNNTTNDVGVDSKNANTKVKGYGKNNSLNEIVNMIKKELNILELDKGIINNAYKEIEKIATDLFIKEQVQLKTEEIKNIVSAIIENKFNLKPETFTKVMDLFNQNINDIKIYNSMSEQYYLLDLPINVEENEHQLKLIIKDDRKKGKKIDSKNVKIATSVKTMNMGTVDAYIKVNNNNMTIDIKCDKLYVRALDFSKENLVKDLSSMNYRVSIKVNKKVNEFTLASCGEFFNDRSLNAINIKV